MAKSETKKNWKISAAQLTAAAAIITSVIALAVSIYETRIMRSWQQASTQPIVEFQLEGEFVANPLVLNLYLKNMGQGTAYIQGVKIIQGETQVNDFKGFIETFPSPKNITKRSGTDSYRGYLEPTGRKHPMNVSMTFADGMNFKDILSHSQLVADTFEKTDISVCYCSIFERCWINDFKTQTRAKLVPVCPPEYK